MVYYSPLRATEGDIIPPQKKVSLRRVSTDMSGKK
ncbi:hypothetical protein TSAR_002673 [Trichomalopsis sarcophagae]|uniref:Uncharacterized protein n=1 Tax=Trichomalopsis sarcophagae TaxID=543379 RepID=A0A232F1J4_9HYME|nr:hypothetical protein TSAR_002673 [Trichomalopsis sarcophagae]